MLQIFPYGKAISNYFFLLKKRHSSGIFPIKEFERNLGIARYISEQWVPTLVEPNNRVRVISSKIGGSLSLSAPHSVVGNLTDSQFISKDSLIT